MPRCATEFIPSPLRAKTVRLSPITENSSFALFVYFVVDPTPAIHAPHPRAMHDLRGEPDALSRGPRRGKNTLTDTHRGPDL